MIFLFGIFTKTDKFEPFGQEHFLALFFFFCVGLVSIWIGRNKLDYRQQTLFGTALALCVTVAVIGRMLLTIYTGEFGIKSELPLHVCRVLGLTIPFAMYSRSRKWLGVFYFMILAGTLQANITPDIDFDFPHYGYFTYWLMHSMLVILPLYAVFVYGHRYNIKDLWRAFVVTNVFMVIITLINFMIGSNYMYTLNKPPVQSMLDYMGPWPWYILAGELVALILFFLFYLPFAFDTHRIRRKPN